MGAKPSKGADEVGGISINDIVSGGYNSLYQWKWNSTVWSSSHDEIHIFVTYQDKGIIIVKQYFATLQTSVHEVNGYCVNGLPNMSPIDTAHVTCLQGKMLMDMITKSDFMNTPDVCAHAGEHRNVLIACHGQ